MNKYDGLFGRGDVIRTHSLQWVDVFNPDPETLVIEDIAHALSNQPRFTGHTDSFYSVAQHSIMTAMLVPDEHKLTALMHDASEAYLMDIASPIKAKLANYKDIENGLMAAIAKKFGFTYPLPKEVKDADLKMLHSEWEDLMIDKKTTVFVSGYSMVVMTPPQAKAEFIRQFNQFHEPKFLGAIMAGTKSERFKERVDEREMIVVGTPGKPWPKDPAFDLWKKAKKERSSNMVEASPIPEGMMEFLDELRKRMLYPYTNIREVKLPEPAPMPINPWPKSIQDALDYAYANGYSPDILKPKADAETIREVSPFEYRICGVSDCNGIATVEKSRKLPGLLKVVTYLCAVHSREVKP